jgi:hypothetical protein
MLLLTSGGVEHVMITISGISSLKKNGVRSDNYNWQQVFRITDEEATN